eukprot:gene14236-14356_t
MAFDPITGALELGGKLIDKLIPDPQAKAQATLQLMQLKASGELSALTADTDLAKAQVEVNKAEATSASLFVAGWRPFVGWTCGVGLANDFILRPLAIYVSSVCHVTGAIWPALDMTSLLPLLLGMLGLGAMRTFEKTQN